MTPATAIPVKGFAAPYGVENTWRETFTPRVMKGLLTPVPMLLMHDIVAGVWTNVYENEKGIFCEGLITNYRMIDEVKKVAKLFGQLSVSWCGTRECARSERLSGGVRRGDVPVIVKPGMTRGITEISLVDGGAFPGTHWELVNQGS